MKITGKLVRNGDAQAVTVPRTHLHQLGWRPDEPLALIVVSGMLVVSSMRAEVERHERRAAELVAAMDQAATP
jgi:antitoxin component of MazEF toxin-antitoxin module